MSREYHEGFEIGLGLGYGGTTPDHEQNPYHRGSVEHREWSAGLDDGHMEGGSLRERNKERFRIREVWDLADDQRKLRMLFAMVFR